MQPLEITSETTSLVDLLPPELYLDDQGKLDVEKLAHHMNFSPPSKDTRLVKKISGTDDKNHSSAYRSIYTGDTFIQLPYPGFDNMVSAYQRSLEQFGERNCLGTRLTHEDGTVDDFFTYQSYNTVFKRRDNLGSGLRTLVGRHDKFVVCIYSPNRADWVISYLACQAYDMIYTSLYDTLGPKTSNYILNLTEAPAIIVSRDKVIKVIDLKKTTGLPHLKYVISMDPLNLERDFGLVQLAQSQGIKLLDMAQVEALGKMTPMDSVIPKPDDVFGISFTSGTTGNPKGVEITHRMAVSHLCFSIFSVDMNIQPGKQTRVLSFLPLAHIYEVTNMGMQLFSGCSIAFAPDPSPTKLVENLAIVKPNFIALVPRVYTKIEAALKETMSSSFVGRQILAGIERKMDNASDDGPVSNLILDNLALKKISKKLGFSECALAASGSAPISAETVHFLRASLGCGFAQGYGLTESTSGISVMAPWEKDVSCGALSLTVEVRLRDIPEMNYVTHDAAGNEVEEPQGELLLRGPQIFKHYYKNDKATKESFDDEGWFKTGDVAKLDSRGCIHIVDRVKNFFKLAQGEYITPERIENTYLSVCSFLTQMFVHGDSLKTFLVSIVGVDPNSLRTHLRQLKRTSHIAKLSDEELLKEVNTSPEIKRSLLLAMNSAVQGEGLQGFEKVHNIKFMIEPLKISDDTITPTLKIKRNIASKFFAKDVNALYEEGSLIKTRL